MRIGNRTYKVKKSNCWLVFPSMTLTVNIWTDNETTYLLIEPIKFSEPQKFIASQFQSQFTIQEIDDIDSTLLENDKAIEIWKQKVEFDVPSLFKLKKVSISGETINNDFVKVDTKTIFRGFEVWKKDGYQIQVREIEKILKKISVPFSTTNEESNELIRIKIESYTE